MLKQFVLTIKNECERTISILCKRWGETSFHLFLECELNSGLSSLWLSLTKVTTTLGCTYFSLKFIHEKEALGDLRKEYFYEDGGATALFWMVWLNRNRRIFDDKHEVIWKQITYVVALWPSTSTLFEEASFNILQNVQIFIQGH